MRFLKKLFKKVFCTVSVLLVCLVLYVVVGLVGSLTMLDPTYFQFQVWPTWVRLVYVSFSLYVMAHAVKEDYRGWERGN